jgi:hypothetical protein
VVARRRRRRERRRALNPGRQQDARLVAARALAANGVAYPAETWILAVSPVRMDDNRVLMWHPPQAVAFGLVDAKTYRDRGSKQRRSLMSQIRVRRDGNPGFPNPSAVIDCVRDLQSAVLYAFTAIESFANHVVDMLEDEAEADLKAGAEPRMYERKGEAMPWSEVVRLSMDEKLKKVLPMKKECAHVAGDAEVWGRYRALKFLRDELVHVKERGYDPDPNTRTAYDRLIMGEGDMCVEDARTLIDRCWPGWLPDRVAAVLDR